MRARVARFTAVSQAVLLMATLILPALAAATEITTDLWIYQDGDTVTVTGIDFGANEVVDFVTTDPEGTVVDTGSAVSDDVGGVVYAFVLHVTVPGIYDVVATGQTSGLSAWTQFDPPSDPSQLRFVDSRSTATSQVALAWAGGNVPTVAANCWIVYRGTSSVTTNASNSTCTGPLFGSAIARVAANSTPAYTDTSVVAGTNYYYLVTGVRTNGTAGQNGQSGPSNQVTTADVNITAPASFDFGSVNVAFSSQITFNVTNGGVGTSKVNSVVTTGGDAAQFVVANVPTGGASSIAAGGTWSFDVTFEPTSLGAKTTTLEIHESSAGQSGATENIRRIRLDGNGIDNVDPTLANVMVNGGAAFTGSTAVTVFLDGFDNLVVTHVRVANGADCSTTAYVAVSVANPFTLNPGPALTLPSGDGAKIVCAQVKDAQGNESLVKTDTIVLDTVAPVGSIVINSGAASTNNPNVTVSLNATDLNGITNYRLAQLADCTGTTYFNTSTTTSLSLVIPGFALSGGDGVKTVCAMFKDVAGNDSLNVVDTIILDTAGPTITLSSLVGSAGSDSVAPLSVVTNDGATINWSANESGTFEICRNNCSSTLVVGSSSYSTGPVATAIPAASLVTGPANYVICATDSLGNQAVSSPFAINKDTSTTTTLARTAGANPSNLGAPVTFTATVTAPGGNPSGVGTVTFFDGVSPISGCITVPLTGNTANCTVSTLTAGSHSLTAVFNGASAGGSTWATSTSLALSHTVINVDSTAPVISYVIVGTAGANGWYVSDLTVQWTVVDPESAVVIDSGCGDQPFTAETAGATSSCSAHSAGGAASDSVVIKLDKTGPSAGLAVTAGTLGSNGWYTSDVTVDTTGTDSISNPTTCTVDQYQTTDTTASGVDFNGSCTNDAGLSTDGIALNVKLDKTGPSAALAVTAGTAGTNGWYTSNVTVSTTGTDDQGPVTCSADQFQTTETTGQAFAGSCTNDAGLSTDATALTVKLDKTGPSATLAADRAPDGANGWYIADLTVSTSGADSISSPVTCTADQPWSTETTGQAFAGSCTNDAGLSTNATALTVKLDKTGPSASLAVTAGTLGSNGWYTSNVTVDTSGTDLISSPVTCTVDQFQTTETTGQAFAGSCTNDAGLSTNATALTVKLDKTGPSAALAVTAGTAGTNGWYTTNVTVSTSGTDSISSPVTCTADQPWSTETTGQAFAGSCTNDAGLSTDATPLTVKLDKTAPTSVAFGATTLAEGGTYYFGFVPTGPATCTANYDISGSSGCVVSGYSGAVGPHTVQAAATDQAGNVGYAFISYTVNAWTLSGFYNPVDMGGVLNTVKAGSTVPLKFEVFAGPTELTLTSYIQSFRAQEISCSNFGALPVDDIEVTSTGGTQLRYDSTGGQFIQNWQTAKNKAGACYAVTMTTLDGSTLTALFKLK